MVNPKKNEYPNGYDPLMACGDSAGMRAVKLAYRKHVMLDEAIGYDELSNVLGSCLSIMMGADEFCDWIDANRDA